MSRFEQGDRVYVTDPALAQLRSIMRDATGEEPSPNHHGTVAELIDADTVLINFDDGAGAPYPVHEVHALSGRRSRPPHDNRPPDPPPGSTYGKHA